MNVERFLLRPERGLGEQGVGQILGCAEVRSDVPFVNPARERPCRQGRDLA
jgi:hypothetical protein